MEMDGSNGAANAPDVNDDAQAQLVMEPLRAPVTRAAIRALQLRAGSHGLDAGCGVGLQALLLAEAVGPSGRVTGLDLSPELLAQAARIVGAAGMSGRISFEEGDVADLPFADDTFDWAWSMDCVGYMPQAPVPLLRELARVVKPGGKVALLAWSSQMLLPGYPLLEARLNATTAGIAPFAAGLDPARHFLRGLGWFHEAGLEGAKARTFAGDAHAPLRAELHRALASLMQMRWSGAQGELAPADWAAYQRLCRPGSPDCILNRPDYYAFFTYSMFTGLVPANT
jgi:demethylmenaquinone methyltransferase/2-methoxy-6-polyprenyl-1,4-benzoquinol methylase